MIDIDAIEKIINLAAGEYMPAQEVSPTLDKAIEQLAALVERIDTLEQQIQQAERRGWDLKDKYMHLKIWNDAHRCMVNYTYEQAVKERDGGAK